MNDEVSSKSNILACETISSYLVNDGGLFKE